MRYKMWFIAVYKYIFQPEIRRIIAGVEFSHRKYLFHCIMRRFVVLELLISALE